MTIRYSGRHTHWLVMADGSDGWVESLSEDVDGVSGCRFLTGAGGLTGHEFAEKPA